MPKLRHSRGLHDTRYLQLDGSNANQNINIGNYNFTANAFYGDGSGLTGVAAAPTGVISAFGGTVAPADWLLCDGTQVSRTTYAALFTIVGTNYGAGDGATTFHLPDLRGQFLRGRDAGVGVDPDAATRIALNAGGNVGDNVGSAQADAAALPTVAFTSGNQSASHTHSHTHGAIASGNQSASHNHTFTGNALGTHRHYVTIYKSTVGMAGGGGFTTYMAQYGTQNNYTNYVSAGTPAGSIGNQLASHTHSTTIPAKTSGTQSASHTHTITGGGDSETRPINVYVNFIIKF